MYFFNLLGQNIPKEDKEPQIKKINLLKETNSNNKHDILFKIIKNPLNGIAFIENKYEIVYKRSDNKTGHDSITVFTYNKTLDQKINIIISLNNIEGNCSHEIQFNNVIDSYDRLLDMKIRSGELKKKGKYKNIWIKKTVNYYW